MSSKLLNILCKQFESNNLHVLVNTYKKVKIVAIDQILDPH